MDEYTREFEKLLIKCDIQELKEQTIVRYIGGLDLKYANVIELQQYTTFDEVCVLAYKVEQQMKAKPYKRDVPRTLPRNQPLNKGSSTFTPAPKPTAQSSQTLKKNLNSSKSLSTTK